MGAFFVYIVKSAVCLAVFYLFYRLLLSRETFHRFNRIALLGILILSCAIPFVEVTMKEPMEVSQQLLTWEELLLMADLNRTATIEAAPVSAITWREVLLMVYLLGIVFFFLRNVWSLTRMLRHGGTVRCRIRDGTQAGQTSRRSSRGNIRKRVWNRHHSDT